MNMGERIKKFRKDRGMTQKELAKELEIIPNSLSRFELGTYVPSLRIIQMLASIFEVELWQIYYDEKPATSSIGERIKYFREDQKLTLQELADKSKIPMAYIEKFENGEATPSNSDISKLIFALNSTYEVFLMNTDFDSIKTLNITIKSRIDSSYTDKIVESVIGQCLNKSLEQEKLLEYFHKLNDVGQSEAIKRVGELTQIPEYKLPDDESEGSDE